MVTKTKLTVRVDVNALETAKRYAAEQGTSLSKLISEYLRTLPVEETPLIETPILKRLKGILPTNVSEEEYQAHLIKKYGA